MIAVFADFGASGPYLGQMQAVLCDLAPGIPVVDIFPDLPPFDVQAASILLPAYSRYLPEKTVCLCVVDPGVGSDRCGLIATAGGRYYVGPDNGIFSGLAEAFGDVRYQKILWQPEVLSGTFHGRDWFAPVAARLSANLTVDAAPVADTETVRPEWPVDYHAVVYIDVYGNAITGVRSTQLDEGAIIVVNGYEVGRACVFSDVAPGSAFWYENSNGMIEIAINQGSAADILQLRAGSTFSVLDAV